MDIIEKHKKESRSAIKLCPPIGLLAFIYSRKMERAMEERDKESVIRYSKIVGLLLKASFFIALAIPISLIILLIINKS